MNQVIGMLSAGALLLVLAQGTSAATVANVKAQQRPKSNIVDVYYDLVEPDGGLFDVALSIEGGEDRPAMVSLTGDVGIDLTPGRNKHIEWDAGADWPNRVQSNFVATVKATPSIGMVLIPGGTNSGYDNDVQATTKKNYSLSVNSFYMDRAEVSYMRWKAVYDWAVKHGYAFDNEGGSKGMDHPVQKVNWYDCVKWCNARSEMNKREPVYRVGGEVYRSGQADPSANLACDGYRLPTDEEWEYAARGGRSSLCYPWGNKISHEQANFYNSGNNDVIGWYPEYESSPTVGYDSRYMAGGMPYTSPVASFAANDYGLYDVVGNVREWTGVTADSARLRGGSWGTNGKICCLWNRSSAAPDTSNYSNGFRAVRRQ